jgi:hypothetical protein
MINRILREKEVNYIRYILALILINAIDPLRLRTGSAAIYAQTRGSTLMHNIPLNPGMITLD